MVEMMWFMFLVIFRSAGGEEDGGDDVVHVPGHLHVYRHVRVVSVELSNYS